MTVARRARAVVSGRRVAVSFATGLVMGALYWAFGLTAPAPALLGLTGLLGIGLGERAATALGARVGGRRTSRPATRTADGEQASPGPQPRHVEPPAPERRMPDPEQPPAAQNTADPEETPEAAAPADQAQPHPCACLPSSPH
ncbi:DUF1427 family protein [Streptomyces sp. NPDC057806]|uniref:DUF1427 family protein n=1 Tax=unclassified Streptomyces TaxID=2593676 RepID=UPI0036A34854